MNTAKLRRYLDEYKERFTEISTQEIYKWRAIRHFQNTWDPNAADFPAMLLDALSKTSNLMDTSNYFPRGMITELAEHDPIGVRDAFLNLYDDSIKDIERIKTFRETIDAIHAGYGKGKRSYQDDRAVFVYLTLRFPETYFFYKFSMLNAACELLEVAYRPSRGEPKNIVQHMYLCESVRDVIREDMALLEMSARRIGPNEYIDPEHTVLTQDVIYAITTHLQYTENSNAVAAKPQLVLTGAPDTYTPEPTVAQPASIDFTERHRRAQEIGRQGEGLVVEWAIAEYGRESVEHTSASRGDGAGYDILVRDGEMRIFIEVKTTTSGPNTPFEVTRNELEFSKANPVNYRLYRLYSFDLDSNTAQYYVISGSLEGFCTYPTTYRVHLR